MYDIWLLYFLYSIRNACSTIWEPSWWCFAFIHLNPHSPVIEHLFDRWHILTRPQWCNESYFHKPSNSKHCTRVECLNSYCLRDSQYRTVNHTQHANKRWDPYIVVALFVLWTGWLLTWQSKQSLVSKHLFIERWSKYSDCEIKMFRVIHKCECNWPTTFPKKNVVSPVRIELWYWWEAEIDNPKLRHLWLMVKINHKQGC